MSRHRDTYATIAYDAACLSQSSVASSSSIVYGPGTVSGHILKKLGKKILDKMDRAKLQRVESTIRSRDPEEWPPSAILFVLELQKLHLYPDDVRAKAWYIIFGILEKDGGKQLGGVLISWSAVETTLFLRQLQVCERFAWLEHPVSGYSGPAEFYGHARNSDVSARQAELLSASMARLLSEISNPDPFNPGIFPEGCFLLLLTGTTSPFAFTQTDTELLESSSHYLKNAVLSALASGRQMEFMSDSLLQRLDHRYLSRCFPNHDPEIVSLQPKLGELVRSVCTGSDDTLRRVVGHIVDTLHSISKGDLNVRYMRMPDTQLGPGVDSNVHSSWGPLWTAAYLAYNSNAAARHLLTLGVDALIQHFLADEEYAFMMSSVQDYETVKEMLHLASYVLLRAISRHHKVDKSSMAQLENLLGIEKNAFPNTGNNSPLPLLIFLPISLADFDQLFEVSFPREEDITMEPNEEDRTMEPNEVYYAL